MESAWIMLAGMAFGAFVGVAFMIMLNLAQQRGTQAAKMVDPGIPVGVDEMLAAFDTAGLVLDPSNNVLRINEEALELGLLTKRGALRAEIVQFAADARKADYDLEADIALPGESYPVESRRLSLHGARIGARYLVILAIDRTDEDRLEAIRRDFVANISHELKTPTASVRLISEAIDRAAEDPATVRRFNTRLAQEAERLSTIAGEVIELSRLQGDRLGFEVRPVKIAEIIRTAIDDHRVLAEAKSIEIAASLDDELIVDGDAASLRTAVANLISNAIAYSNEKSRIGIGLARHDGMVDISVTDHGIGIEATDLDRVFERFYRVDQARSRHTGGSGLGLSIVKHIASNHGGQVRAWSQPGKGSTFSILLPEKEQP
ncbi:MAG TPA: ATP-binding protein [Microbacteriaceae bacterium]|nr:ATP-binding protein [Microbacteriaceae bacterium]